MAGCTSSLEVRCASALCSPCLSGSSNETIVSEGGVPQLSVILISFYLEAIDPCLPAERSNPAGRNIPSESLSRALILIGLPGSLGNRSQPPSVLGSQKEHFVAFWAWPIPFYPFGPFVEPAVEGEALVLPVDVDACDGIPLGAWLDALHRELLHQLLLLLVQRHKAKEVFHVLGCQDPGVDLSCAAEELVLVGAVLGPVSLLPVAQRRAAVLQALGEENQDRDNADKQPAKELREKREAVLGQGKVVLPTPYGFLASVPTCDSYLSLRVTSSLNLVRFAGTSLQGNLASTSAPYSAGNLSREDGLTNSLRAQM